VLSEEVEETNPLPFVPIPTTITTYSADIDFGGGYCRSRKKRQKFKNKNKEMFAAEKELAAESIKNSDDVLCL
jgi:hypothetical protein